jgi:hypothetical protein
LDLTQTVDWGPASFDTVSATFQKQTQDQSELRVQIIVDDQVKREEATTAAFGIVTVTWSTIE